jgi:phosphotransferase system  glucose/maltose/N-acetylglucosamine-specific IIC component
MRSSGPVAWACLLRRIQPASLVTGLHHILNSLVWFVFGSYMGPDGKAVTGDLHRFFAGDPRPAFMTGFFQS